MTTEASALSPEDAEIIDRVIGEPLATHLKMGNTIGMEAEADAALLSPPSQGVET